jgi:hypothetical protein
MELGLVKLIEQLKSELGELQRAPSHLFTIAGVEVELKFGVEKTIDATAHLEAASWTGIPRNRG